MAHRLLVSRCFHGVVVLFLAWCVTSAVFAQSAAESPREDWDNFDEESWETAEPYTQNVVFEEDGEQRDEDQEKVAEGKAVKGTRPVTVVFYRVGAPSTTLPINIFTNGRYHASLLKDAYTLLRVCPGTHNFYVSNEERLVNTKREILPKNDFVLDPSEKAYFFRVNNAEATIDLVDYNTGKAEADSVPRLQKHTISRLVPTLCN